MTETGPATEWSWPPPHPPEAYRPVSTDRRLAGLALGLSIVPCGWNLLAAVPVAIVALIRIREGRAAGPRLAIAALVISALWLGYLAWGIASTVLFTDAPRDEDGRVTERNEVSVFDLREGDCLDLPEDSRELRSVDVLPCAQRHDLEAYASFELPEGSYPGNREVTRAADRGCLARFRDFVGIPHRRSELGVLPLRPLKYGWTVEDDREVLCLLGRSDGGRVTGSLAGART